MDFWHRSEEKHFKSKPPSGLRLLAFGQSMDQRQQKISESVRRFIKLLETWRRRARSRRELMVKTDRELHDVGITRCDASHEAAKPFWRK
jgi:uncharacterized protein YjiS (DUF1127 family)